MTKQVWKEVEGYEGKYEVSSLGNVRSLDRVVPHSYKGMATVKGRVLKPLRNPDGYLFVVLHKEGIRNMQAIHRLVATYFCDKEDGCNEVNHLNFIKDDNRAENLEWTTRNENMKHAANAGKFRAATNPNIAKKLTPEKVLAIRAAGEAGESHRAIAAKFDIGKTTVGSILKGTTWNI